MNERLRGVDNAATLTASDEKKILQSGGAYFVHHEGELLGAGWLEDTRLLLVAAAKPGAGERVMHTLMTLVEGARITIEVASTNTRALRLYEKLGFLTVRNVLQWYGRRGDQKKTVEVLKRCDIIGVLSIHKNRRY